MRRSSLHLTSSLPLLAALLAACGGRAGQSPDTTPRTGDTMIHENKTREDRASIEGTLRRYEAALNTADAGAAAGLYADDAVFMAQHRAPAVGGAAIRRAYDEIFAAIQLHVTFGIDEIEVIGDTAWARTHSTGETLIRAAGVKVAEHNSELFILRRQPDGAWRIARYLFATQNPPPR